MFILVLSMINQEFILIFPLFILVTLQRIPGLKFLQRYRPVSRKTFAIEVENILNGKESALLKRNIKIK